MFHDMLKTQLILKNIITPEDEILEQDKIMKKEIEDGIIPDPNAPVDPTTGMPLGPETAQMDLGQPVMEPNLDAQGKATQVDAKVAEMPKGGEI